MKNLTKTKLKIRRPKAPDGANHKMPKIMTSQNKQNCVYTCCLKTRRRVTQGHQKALAGAKSVMTVLNFPSA